MYNIYNSVRSFLDSRENSFLAAGLFVAFLFCLLSFCPNNSAEADEWNLASPQPSAISWQAVEWDATWNESCKIGLPGHINVRGRSVNGLVYEVVVFEKLQGTNVVKVAIDGVDFTWMEFTQAQAAMTNNLEGIGRLIVQTMIMRIVTGE